MTQPSGQQPQQPPPQGQPYAQQSQYDPQQSTDPQSHYSPQQPVATATTKGRFNVTVAVLAAIAAVLGVLALFVLGWYRDNFQSVSGGSSSNSKFSKIHDALNSAQHSIDSNPSVGKYIHFGVSPTYFGWLAYVLIVGAVVLTFISAAPLGGAVVVVKAFSALVAAVGLGLTFWAIDLINFDSQIAKNLGSGAPSGYGDWIKHTSFGAWAMMLAFLLCLIGSLLPPKHKAIVTNQY
jgi:hypothetical protein